MTVMNKVMIKLVVDEFLNLNGGGKHVRMILSKEK